MLKFPQSAAVSPSLAVLWWLRKAFIHLNFSGTGGQPKWIGDNFCDDVNNNDICDYDKGDCCGIDVRVNFCVNCTCKGPCKLKLFLYIFRFSIIVKQNYLCIDY